MSRGYAISPGFGALSSQDKRTSPRSWNETPLHQIGAAGLIRVAPMICYEDILPETAAEIAVRSPHANLLATLVNHAWFGASLAPSESLALATFRSVELRRALIRAANTGVSSIGDALGRVVAEGPLIGVSADHLAPPLRLQGDVALLEIPVLGPLVIAGFPYMCAAGLVAAMLLTVRRGARRQVQG